MGSFWAWGPVRWPVKGSLESGQQPCGEVQRTKCLCRLPLFLPGPDTWGEPPSLWEPQLPRFALQRPLPQCKRLRGACIQFVPSGGGQRLGLGWDCTLPPTAGNGSQGPRLPSSLSLNTFEAWCLFVPGPTVAGAEGVHLVSRAKASGWIAPFLPTRICWADLAPAHQTSGTPAFPSCSHHDLLHHRVQDPVQPVPLCQIGKQRLRGATPTPSCFWA